MASTDDTILSRAVRSWEASGGVAFLQPVLAHPQPEQYALSRRIAEEYRGYFDEELVALLASPNPVVVVQALVTLHWMRSPILDELPERLLTDERTVIVAGCLLDRKSVGEIARECARKTRNAGFRSS